MENHLITTEIFIIPYGDAYLVYAPLRKVAFIANDTTVNTISMLKKGILESLNSEQLELVRFLDAVGIMGNHSDHQIRGLYQDNYEPNEVTLFLTSECNLRCKYCYAMAGNVPVTRMSLETAQRGINHVFQNALRLNTGWFGVYYHGGGEPTINKEVLIKSWEYANNLAKDNQFQLYSSITTNGVMPPLIRSWIIDNLQTANISLDGPPQVNDINRPNRAGSGSGKHVLETLKEFDAAKFNYGIRVTISALTASEIPNIIQFIVDNTNPRAIKVEPVYDIGRGKDLSLHVDVASFIDGFMKGKEIAANKGIQLLYSAARLDTISSRFCRAYGEGFTLTPTGEVTGCFEVTDNSAMFSDKMIFGKFDEHKNEYVFNNDLLIPLRTHNVAKQSYCNGCFAKWHCSGDCPNKVEHSLIDGQFQGIPSCDITRSLLLNEIVESIEKSGGLVWKG